MWDAGNPSRGLEIIKKGRFNKEREDRVQPYCSLQLVTLAVFTDHCAGIVRQGYTCVSTSHVPALTVLSTMPICTCSDLLLPWLRGYGKESMGKTQQFRGDAPKDRAFVLESHDLWLNVFMVSQVCLCFYCD